MTTQTPEATTRICSQGKTKTLYYTTDPHYLVMEFRDDTTAFDGSKKESLTDKGAVNNAFNAHMMQLLARQGIPVHLDKRLDERRSLVQKLQMIPLEAVLRNISTGSLCRRLGVDEGLTLQPPIFEFFYKDDDRGDPMVNESHAITFGWATSEQMQQMQQICVRVNDILKAEFARGGLQLVDYKLEFGTDGNGRIVLGDELTPDSARIWRLQDGKKMDKDRFRQNLGSVVESYREVAESLNIEGLPQLL
ncbi:MAG: phosphoribosylaminoimidazolesuccinocarboxamide synthase [Gammaproteobacteria bacterium]